MRAGGSKNLPAGPPGGGAERRSVDDDTQSEAWRLAVTQQDTARISAELTRFSHGNDPFAEAVRATRMPMVISDPRLPDNPVVFANAAFCRLTGYARAEIIGRNCRFLQGPETDPEAVARIRAAVQEARPIEIDIRNHRKGGESFWNRLLMAPVYGADGKLAYFFASQVDVTIERERLAGLETHNAALMAEVAGRLRAQQESEARLRFATQAGGLGIWELDLRNWTLNASGLFKRIFGRDPNAPFSHEEMVAAIHPDDRDRVLAAKRHAAATGTEYNCEYRVIRPDHEIGWVQVRAQVVRSIDGSALRMAGICLDTTERRNAEIKLELSEESLRLAAAAAELGTWDYNPATDALTWTGGTISTLSTRTTCQSPGKSWPRRSIPRSARRWNSNTASSAAMTARCVGFPQRATASSRMAAASARWAPASTSPKSAWPRNDKPSCSGYGTGCARSPNRATSWMSR
jgi:PAS domain S-box-containing protein